MTSNQNSVQFIPMTCPSCGGELMISAKVDQAICNYCGKSFLVVKDQKEDGITVKNYIELGKTALASLNYEEAYNYYSKALEIEPRNHIAWYGKAVTTFWHSPSRIALSCNLYDEYLIKMDEAKSYYEIAVSYAPEIERQAMQYKFSIENVCMWGACASVIDQMFENGLVREEDIQDEILAGVKCMFIDLDKFLKYIFEKTPKYSGYGFGLSFLYITNICKHILSMLKMRRAINLHNPVVSDYSITKSLSTFEQYSNRFSTIVKEMFENEWYESHPGQPYPYPNIEF